MAAAKIRLYVDHPLGQGQSVPLSRDQAHYLFGVMRMEIGRELFVFNGKDAEFIAKIEDASRKGGMLVCCSESRPLEMPPDVWLLFAPVKKSRTDFIVEKATEMGARRIIPVLTEYTNAERIRKDRLQAHAIEAAEQCGGTYVPEVAELKRLDRFLQDWPVERQLLFCDEALVGVREALTTAEKGPWAILIGPEGGFSSSERRRLLEKPYVTATSLGPRILRADTAAVAALTLWQSYLGDW